MSKKQQKKEPGLWTISNGISFIRLLSAAPLAVLLVNPIGNQLAILGLCVFGYISDLADGYIARLRKEQSDVGRILDPLADKVVVITIVISMLANGLLPPWYVYIVLGRDIVIFLSGMYLKKLTGILVESNMMGKVTVVSIMIVIVMALFKTDISTGATRIVMLVSLGLMAASLYMYGERFFKLLSKHKSKK